MRRSPLFFTCLSLLLCGCSLTTTNTTSAVSSGHSLRGNVYGGQQPIVGSHVYLFAANTIGYGAASISLLSGTSDSVGGYVSSGSDGGFSITGDYRCASGDQVYLYALGGDPGAGVNSAAGLLAALGTCPASGNFKDSIPFININEVTTVAAAYALSGFATDATHISSPSTPLARTGVANAFANAANLASLASGAALSTTPAGNGQVPTAEINTLADILAACVNSNGPASAGCTRVLPNAQDGSGTTPTDTASAAINIAHQPAANAAALFAAVSAEAPFNPTLSTAPNDWTIELRFFTTSPKGTYPPSVAVDAAGEIWFQTISGMSDQSVITKLSATGAILSGTGYDGASFATGRIFIDSTGDIWYPTSGAIEKIDASNQFLGAFQTNFIDGFDGLAFDGAGNVWVANSPGSGLPNALYEFNSSGGQLSARSGVQGGGYSGSGLLAIDSGGNVWSANGSSLSEFSAAGVALSGSSGFAGGGLSGTSGIAIDNAGNVWTSNGNGSVSKFSSAGVPLSGASGFTGGGLARSSAIAIDGAGSIWVGNTTNISHLSNLGSPLSTQGIGGGGDFNAPSSLAVDGSGNLWFPIVSAGPMSSTGINLGELVGVATPVVTPVSAGIATMTLGSRP